VTKYKVRKWNNVKAERTNLRKCKKCRKWAWRNGRAHWSGWWPVRSFRLVIKNWGQYGQTRPVSEKERPDQNDKCQRAKTSLSCQWKRMCPVSTCTLTVGHAIMALMPTRWNADHRKWQYLAAMPTWAIRLTITRQCDIVVSTVGRHSVCSASSFYRAACNADAVLWWEFCPSVCLSHAYIVTKRKKDRSRFLYHTKEHLA